MSSINTCPQSQTNLYPAPVDDMAKSSHNMSNNQQRINVSTMLVEQAETKAKIITHPDPSQRLQMLTMMISGSSHNAEARAH